MPPDKGNVLSVTTDNFDTCKAGGSAGFDSLPANNNNNNYNNINNKDV
jgi:hypothetical protein